MKKFGNVCLVKVMLREFLHMGWSELICLSLACIGLVQSLFLPWFGLFSPCDVQANQREEGVRGIFSIPFTERR